MIFHLRKIKNVFLPEDRKTRKQSKQLAYLGRTYALQHLLSLATDAL